MNIEASDKGRQPGVLGDIIGANAMPFLLRLGVKEKKYAQVTAHKRQKKRPICSGQVWQAPRDGSLQSSSFNT